ncbi:TIGR04076 family protein [Clostridium chromiireducens]|uniref:TIGR04076 family protein n=1 Tax=Clostridium chromiireducens TaxID=225345 RepID=UPI003AF50282
MSEFSEYKVKIVVKSSKCHLYEAGDEIYLDGAVLNKEKSANVCLTAISAFYPFIYAARKRVTAEQMGFDELTFQCPDCPETVEFTIVQYEDE